MYQFTFWFVYVVYVFDSVEVFGPEIVGILTVWGFRLRLFGLIGREVWLF